MISCADFMAEFGNYLEGDLAQELRQRLELHLSHCATCQVIVDSSRKTIRIVTDSGSFDFPEPVLKPILHNVMSRIRSQRGGS